MVIRREHLKKKKRSKGVKVAKEARARLYHGGRTRKVFRPKYVCVPVEGTSQRMCDVQFLPDEPLHEQLRGICWRFVQKVERHVVLAQQ